MSTLWINNLLRDELRAGGLVRTACEKFAGAWVACLLVMARGNIVVAFSFDHIWRATVCGTVGAVTAVALLVQMNRTSDSLSRQATVSAVVTFIGDIFAHPPHFTPQWAEPLVTAMVSAAIAVALWYTRRWVRSYGLLPSTR